MGTDFILYMYSFSEYQYFVNSSLYNNSCKFLFLIPKHFTNYDFQYFNHFTIDSQSYIEPTTKIIFFFRKSSFKILFQGSQVLVNLSFIMKDPKYFENPLKFNPHRFLDQDGKFVKNERIIPFGIGQFKTFYYHILLNKLISSQCRQW